MKSHIAIAVACLAVSGCSSFQGSTAEPPVTIYMEEQSEAPGGPDGEVDAAPAPASAPVPAPSNAEIDDYRWDGGMIVRPGEKQIRQLEIEKIHRLAKECIRANNVSKACNDIIALDAEHGKVFINQSLRPFSRTGKPG